MTKAEMVNIIQARYQEAVDEYKTSCNLRPLNHHIHTQKLAHLNEVRYIANLLGIELPVPQAETGNPEK